MDNHLGRVVLISSRPPYRLAFVLGEGHTKEIKTEMQRNSDLVILPSACDAVMAL